MKKFSLIIFICLSFQLLFSQESPLMPAASTITKEELSEHVYKLASESFDGRYTGSEGQRMAAEYIQKEFREDGLYAAFRSPANPFLQEFALAKCYWKEQNMIAAGLTFEAGKDFIFLSGPDNIEGNFPVVFAGFGIEDPIYSDYKNLDVEGKIVLVFSGEPKRKDGKYLLSGQSEPSRKGYYFSKSATAAEKGAVGLIVIAREEKDFRKYLKHGTDYRKQADISYPSPEDQKDIFSMYTRLEAGAKLLGTDPEKLEEALNGMESGLSTVSGRFHGSIRLKTVNECYPMNTENVIGVIVGTDLKDEAVVVIAHYDHHGRKDGKLYPGADDNATGTAAVMEVAEAFVRAAQDGYQPRRTVIFIAATAEEIGLFGSRYYSEHPVIPLDKTFACVNIDMIGRASTKLKDQPDYVGGYAYLSEDIMKISQQYNRLFAAGLEDRMEFRAHPRGGSDHFYFAKDGIPSLFYFTGIHKDYHEPTDTPDKILYDRMEKIVRAIFGTTWELANRDEELKIED